MGTLTLAACGNEPTERRDVYASLDACAKDWGRPEKCEATPSQSQSQSSANHGSSNTYLGPRYASRVDTTGKPLTSNNAHRTVSVSRGGFGSSAGVHGSGG